MKFKIITKKQYDDLIRLLKEALSLMKKLQAERDYYKKSWEDLQRFCINFTKDHDIDFPNSHPIIEPNMDDHWRL